MTRVSGETGSPTRVKNINAERPKASAGSTSGDMNSESRILADSARDRPMTSAAATPSPTEATVVQIATLKLLAAANWSCQASISAAYQRSEYPGGGNLSENPLVNETISTTSVGATRRMMPKSASSPMAA